jgi:hypothetical protein
VDPPRLGLEAEPERRVQRRQSQRHLSLALALESERLTRLQTIGYAAPAEFEKAAAKFNCLLNRIEPKPIVYRWQGD